MISLPTFPEQVPLLPPAPPVPDLGNLLRGIAWLSMANARHVQRVWLPDRSIDRARVLLVRLQQQGLVDAYRWYVPQSRTVRRRDGTRRPVPPHDGGYWWFVTHKGAEFATTLAGEPVRSVGLRAPQLVAHDRLVVNALVQMLLLARPHGLSGAYVEREALLNPPALKPRMDGDDADLRTSVSSTASGRLPHSGNQRSCRGRTLRAHRRSHASALHTTRVSADRPASAARVAVVVVAASAARTRQIGD